jgi:hypothetical protein
MSTRIRQRRASSHPPTRAHAYQPPPRWLS